MRTLIAAIDTAVVLHEALHFCGTLTVGAAWIGLTPTCGILIGVILSDVPEQLDEMSE